MNPERRKFSCWSYLLLKVVAVVHRPRQVWIAKAGDITPIQATGGWLPCSELVSSALRRPQWLKARATEHRFLVGAPSGHSVRWFWCGRPPWPFQRDKILVGAHARRPMFLLLGSGNLRVGSRTLPRTPSSTALSAGFCNASAIWQSS